MLRGALKHPARLLSYAPTIAVLGLLAGLGWYGHEHGWRWEGKDKDADNKKANRSEAEATPPEDPEEKYGFSKFDSTLPIEHDPDRCELNGRVVKVFGDREAVRKAGILLGTVQEREIDEVLTATGAVEFDPRLIARVAPRVGGSLHFIDKQVGDKVEPNETLAIVDSLEVGKAKAAFRMARLQADVKHLFRETLQTGVNPQRTIAEADGALREARLNLIAAHQGLLGLGFRIDLAEAEKLGDADLQRFLLYLGFSDKERSDLHAKKASENLLPVLNPLSVPGEVLKREGVTGEPVAAQQTLFVVGDTKKMVLMIDIPQEKRHSIKNGQKVAFFPDGSRKNGNRKNGDGKDSGKNDRNRKDQAAGTIDWIAPEIDAKTRTVKARVFVPNPDGHLKAGVFGVAQITIREKRLVAAVPEEAVQWEGCSHIVFVCEEVDDDDDAPEPTNTGKQKARPLEFRVRNVILDIRRNGFVEVRPGIKERFALDFFHLLSDDGFIRCEYGVVPGERIAVLGSHVLKSELFRDRLGTAEE